MSEQQYTGEYAPRLYEIDARIEDLKAHMSMWSRAGGRGGAMAMQAVSEINELKAEKERILNGTQAKIDKISKKIKSLQEQKQQVAKINLIKQSKLNKQIREQEEEIAVLKRR